jgi:hypothetical protein
MLPAKLADLHLMRQKRAFPRKRLVKICTMRFRGNAASVVGKYRNEHLALSAA